MTPMVADRGGPAAITAAPSSEQSAQAQKPVVRRPRPSNYADMQQSQGIYRPDYRRPQTVQSQGFNFESLFGGPSWFRRQ
jgi:hypothetical protein